MCSCSLRPWTASSEDCPAPCLATTNPFAMAEAIACLRVDGRASLKVSQSFAFALLAELPHARPPFLLAGRSGGGAGRGLDAWLHCLARA
eukprot:scaffold1236_cov170-Ochromonas_danica.AAC.9